MDWLEKLVEDYLLGYARLFLAFIPALVCFLAFASGCSAALYRKEGFSFGLPREPTIYAWIAIVLLIVSVLCTRALPKLLRRVNHILPIRRGTLELLCGFSFLLGLFLGHLS